MKEFRKPRMDVVVLSNENVICTSDCPSHDICSRFDCPDCAECTGIYTCFEFICHEKYNG